MGNSNPLQTILDLGTVGLYSVANKDSDSWLAQQSRDAWTAGSAGIWDASKDRLNMPFSGSQIRTGGEATINSGGFQQPSVKEFSNDFTQNEFAHQITPYVGMVGGAMTGAGLASGMGASAMTGAMMGSGAVQLGNQVYNALNPQGQIIPGVPQGGAMPGGAGITPQQMAALGAQQSDPYRGLAPRFEQRIQGKQESPGLSTLPMVPQYYQQ